MHGVSAGIDGIVNQMSDTRLRIQSRVSISEPLPLAHLARIESVPGVQGVGFYNFFARLLPGAEEFDQRRAPSTSSA